MGSISQSIAEALGRLGERSVAPDLLRLLADKQLDPSTRQSIVRALATLISREEEVRTLISLLSRTEFKSANAVVYLTLWSVSRRCGLRILAGQERIEVVRRSLVQAEQGTVSI